VIGTDTTRSSETVGDSTDLPKPGGSERDPETTANPDSPLASYAGFDTAPNTPEARVRNLLHAANRAWYKQAKHSEQAADPDVRYRVNDVLSYHIGNGYSSTNAHETLAMTNQVLQVDNDATHVIQNMVKYHPTLVHTYLDVYDVPDETDRVLREKTDIYGQRSDT